MRREVSISTAFLKAFTQKYSSWVKEQTSIILKIFPLLVFLIRISEALCSFRKKCCDCKGNSTWFASLSFSSSHSVTLCAESAFLRLSEQTFRCLLVYLSASPWVTKSSKLFYVSIPVTRLEKVGQVITHSAELGQTRKQLASNSTLNGKWSYTIFHSLVNCFVCKQTLKMNLVWQL